MKEKYGSFDRENNEFVINNPQTPRPWINYIFNRDYCGLVSSTGGGYSFLQDCRLNLVTRWQGQNLLTDEPGRYVYVRDEDSGQFHSATWRPVCVDYDRFECRHGFGYTQITQETNGIETVITYFVPRDESLEVWDVKIRNVSDRDRRISTFSCAEMVMGSRDRELQYRNIAGLHNRTEYREEENCLVLHKVTPYPNQIFGFFASSEKPAGVDMSRETFLGSMGKYENPAVLQDGTCKGSDGYGEDVIAVQQHRFALKQGEDCRFQMVMGCYDDDADLSRKVALYTDTKEVDAALTKVRSYWQEIRETCQMETPDSNLDVLVNDWLKLQLTVSNYWSRSPSFYHEGFGGFGFRDSAQDAEGMVGLDADYARYKLGWLLKCQKQTGQPMPGWSLLTGVYPHDPFKDHPIWLPFTVSAYIRETGNVDFLKEVVPFCDEGKATVYEHLRREILFIAADKGEKGFIHFGQNRHADWNDAFDGCTENAESVWLTMGVCRSLLSMIDLAGLMGEDKDVALYRELHKIFSDVVNKKGWDGEWYVRGYSNTGQVIGSKDNKEGQIFLNAQSWAVLGGVADEARQTQCLDSAIRLLDSDVGLQLLAPPYETKDTDLGRITYFAKGTKENAAVFCHAVGFMIVAFCQAGRGGDAFDALRKIMPSNKEQEGYVSEPYAFSEYIVGPSHPKRSGQGQFTWVTGTAAWVYVIATQWIAGLRPEFDGLRIDPCVPAEWSSFSIKRTFRNAVYDVKISNPEHVEKGVKSIHVDGELYTAELLPIFNDNATHKIEVTMG